MSHFVDMIRLIYMNDKDKEFQKHYNLLISMCYRMMGSFTEAEDIVQDVAVEWIKYDTNEILNARAWLIKVTTNKAIDSLKRAYKKREVYTGSWLPEILPDSLISWDSEIEKKETLRTSFLILLETLNPKERAVYILKEVFEYNYKEISHFISLTEGNCRKIFQRAKTKICNNSLRFDNYSDQSLSILEQFFKCALAGSEEEIKDILHGESEFWSDGGGKAAAVPQIFYGLKKISRFFGNIYKPHMKQRHKYKFEYIFINNSPGAVISTKSDDDLWNIETIFSFELIDNKVARIYAQRNPEKINFIEHFLKEVKHHHSSP